ncbi:uncharacterized protein DS421_1g12290 [Arachis hypogaea]|nr:uncharacterized protein DS421_1g12290 [Arachis hypogaea]
MVILGAVLSVRAVVVDLELLQDGATRRVLLLLNHGLCGRDSAVEEHFSELLAAAGVVAGPVRNRSCLIVLFHVAMVIAKVAGN